MISFPYFIPSYLPITLNYFLTTNSGLSGTRDYINTEEVEEVEVEEDVGVEEEGGEDVEVEEEVEEDVVLEEEEDTLYSLKIH